PWCWCLIDTNSSDCWTHGSDSSWCRHCRIVVRWSLRAGWPLRRRGPMRRSGRGCFAPWRSGLWSMTPRADCWLGQGGRGRSGVTEKYRTRIVGAAAGHPLALTLAARATQATNAEPLDTAIAHLAWRYLGEIADAKVREALRVSSVARRISRDLLRAVFPESDADELYRQLATLPVVTAGRDGLAVDGAVREALAAELEAADPERHRSARQWAWRHLREQARTAATGELWRSTADLIHLIRNPVIREAFFPRD